MAAIKTTKQRDMIRDMFPEHEYTDNKCFTIYNMQLAGYLMMHHLKLVEIKPDRQCPTRTVFFFRDTPELHRLMQQYMTDHK